MLTEFIANEGARIIKFGVVAVARTLLDIGMWKGFVIFIENNPDFDKKVQKFKMNAYSFAHGLSFLISVVISYFANKLLVFQDNNSISEAEQVFRFSIVSLAALVVSTIAIQIASTNPLLSFPKKWHPLIEKNWPLITKLFAIAVATIVNYVGYSFWTFG